MTSAALDQTTYNYCALPLAAYACRPDQSRGRIYDEPDSKNRTPFQRDRDRIIHCGAFRRLKYKTQVFVYHEGDHYRTRLTHTLEVAQIARSLARALMVNEDLAESVALAHDLGHTPFAHVGEDVMKECMVEVGGFDHNDQSLRVLTMLENRYPKWRGLNLTWETLEGVAKHNGPLIKKGDNPEKSGLPVTVIAVNKQMDLELDTYASLEAQVAALADDIAYNNHDVEDGLRAGLFNMDVLRTVPLLSEIIPVVEAQYPDASEKIMMHEVIREMIGAMITDVLDETRRRLKVANPQSAGDIRNASNVMVAFSDDMLPKINALREFLWTNMYHHSTVRRMRLKVSRIVRDLYDAFMGEFALLPEEWQKTIINSGADKPDRIVDRARIIADYIAGMTDRYAIKEHERLFELYWDLR
ncbi:MAG: Deoxyguanosinetriphosphate triphosphohydrolase [Micavibrio sp.]|nr:Deoxyguanosinetriphosphate triphosphohydrolase [Micavibrio sp.]